MDFVRLPRPLLEEFITLWDQVQFISATLPEQARHLIHRLDDKVAEIRSQATSHLRQEVTVQNPKVEVGELSNVYRLAGTMRQAKMIMDLTKQFLTSSCIKHQVSEPDEDDRS